MLIEQLEFLIRTHDLGRIVLVAHEDCVFYLERLSVPAADVTTHQRADLLVEFEPVPIESGTALR